MSYSIYPIVFMILSTLSLAVTGLVTKELTSEVAIAWLVFLRFFIPSAILLLALREKALTRPTKRLNQALYTRAFCIAACQFCFVYAVEHLTLVESIVLFGTGPLFIPLLEKLIYGVKLNLLTILTLLMTFTGVLLLAGDVGGIHFRPELLVGLAAGIFNGGSQVTLYRASQGELGAAQINFWTFLYAAIVTTPLILYTPFPVLEPEHSMASTTIVATLILMALLIINTQIFRSKAYALVESGSKLAPLIFTNLVFTAFLQFFFYNAGFNAFQILGMTTIVTANLIAVFVPRWAKISKSTRLKWLTS